MRPASRVPGCGAAGEVGADPGDAGSFGGGVQAHHRRRVTGDSLTCTQGPVGRQLFKSREKNCEQNRSFRTVDGRPRAKQRRKSLKEREREKKKKKRRREWALSLHEGPGEKKGFFSLGRKGNGSFGKDVQEPGRKWKQLKDHRSRLGPCRGKLVEREPSEPC